MIGGLYFEVSEIFGEVNARSAIGEHKGMLLHLIMK